MNTERKRDVTTNITCSWSYVYASAIFFITDNLERSDVANVLPYLPRPLATDTWILRSPFIACFVSLLQAPHAKGITNVKYRTIYFSGCLPEVYRHLIGLVPGLVPYLGLPRRTSVNCLCLTFRIVTMLYLLYRWLFNNPHQLGACCLLLPLICV